MKKLLIFECNKIFRQKSFHLCFGISFILLLLNAFMLINMKNEAGEAVFNSTSFMLSALSSSSFTMLLGIFTALYACDDTSNNTLKNIYARGFSRGQVYFSKYLISAFISVLMTLICFAISIVLIELFGKSSFSLNGEILGNLLSQLVTVLGYHALYYSAAMFLGKVGGSVAFNLVGPSLILTVLTLLASLLHFDSIALSDYWLDSTMNALSSGSFENSVFIKAVIMSAVYIFVLLAGGYMLNRKKEI